MDWRARRRRSRSASSQEPIAQIVLPTELSIPRDRTAEIVVARLDTLTRVHTFVEDIELALDPNPVEAAVRETEDGYAVEVTARSLACDVTLLAGVREACQTPQC